AAEPNLNRALLAGPSPWPSVLVAQYSCGGVDPLRWTRSEEWMRCREWHGAVKACVDAQTRLNGNRHGVASAGWEFDEVPASSAHERSAWRDLATVRPNTEGR